METGQQLLTVKLDQFEVGLPLRYDIFDDIGEQLACSGQQFTDALKQKWTALGIYQVRARVADSSIERNLLEPHDTAKLTRLADELKLVSDSVIALHARIAGNHYVQFGEFREISKRFVAEVQADCAASLLTLLNSVVCQPTENDRLLADRCAQLSLLGMILGHVLRLEESECQAAGMVGMLHDISLFGLNEEMDESKLEERYKHHPHDSCSMLENIIGMDRKVLIAISQVHESVLGDGFPRGLQGNRILPLARMINLADCYLTLISNSQPIAFPEGRNLHPADALGYIMYHASQGRFETQTVRALIDATSLYPVGSSVMLSDNTTATVLRSSETMPSRPIVSLDNGRSSIIDLRFSSLSVRGPNRNSAQTSYAALRKSQLPEVYWI